MSSATVSPSTRRAGAITLGGQLVKMIIQFVGLLVLSRMIPPEDFGLVAMLAVLVMLGELLRDFGLTQAAMQARDLTHQQASNLFWAGLAVAVTLAGLMYGSTPAIVGLFDEPLLAKLCPWVALMLVVSAAQAQFQVQLARRFKFKSLTLSEVLAQFCGLAAGVCVATRHPNYSALLVQMLVSGLILLASRALMSQWRPALPRRTQGMSGLYRYGLNVGLAQLVAYGAYNADSYAIGLRFGAAPLGVYSRAYQLLIVPFNQLLGPLTNVLVPILSRQKHLSGDFYQPLLRIQTLMGSLLVFVMSLIVALGGPIVDVLLGSQWDGSADLLRILSLGGCVQVFSYIGYWAYLVSGKTRQLLWQNLVTKGLLAALVVVGSLHSITGVAAGYALGTALSWPITVIWLNRCAGLPAKQYVADALQTIAAGAATIVVATYAFKVCPSALSTLASLTLSGLVAFVPFAAVSLLSPRRRDLLRSFTSGKSFKFGLVPRA